MRIWIVSLVIGLLALCSRSADAFTPESGLWWNAAESGSGYAIEIQNDVLTVLAFTYHADGKSVFYSSANRLQSNMLYRGTLDGYRSGQCLGLVSHLFFPYDAARTTGVRANGES